MGYSTDFYGEFELDKPLTEAQAEYLNRFCQSRRMLRNADKAAQFADPIREVVGLPIGEEAEFYVGSDETDGETLLASDPRYNDKVDCTGPVDFGQRHDASVLDYNRPPSSQPGLWCQWQASEDRQHIQWDGGEKFRAYEAWLRYIIENFLKPWGYVLNGIVEFQGEDHYDRGYLVVQNNVVSTRGLTMADEKKAIEE